MGLTRYILGSLLIALAIAGVTRAQTVDTEKVAKVKAAYVLNFAKFTEWPAEAFETQDSPIVIALVGSRGVEQYLPRLAEGVLIGERRLVIIGLPAPRNDDETGRVIERLRTAHLVYVGRDVPRAHRLREALGGRDILTVGDAPGFAGDGGMLGLVLEDDRVIFEANPDAIRRSRINVSSKVLRLARIVKEDR